MFSHRDSSRGRRGGGFIEKLAGAVPGSSSALLKVQLIDGYLTFSLSARYNIRP